MNTNSKDLVSKASPASGLSGPSLLSGEQTLPAPVVPTAGDIGSPEPAGKGRARGQARPLFDPAIVKRAIVDSFRKLDPRHQVRNPVMFVVEVGSVLTTGLFVQALVGKGEAPGVVHPRHLALALVHGALRELRRGHGRGPRQGAGRLAAQGPQGHPGASGSPRRGATPRSKTVVASELRKGDLVLVEAGDGDPRATARSSRASPRSTRAPSPARARRSSARAAATAARSPAGRASSPTGSSSASRPTRARRSSTG